MHVIAKQARFDCAGLGAIEVEDIYEDTPSPFSAAVSAVWVCWRLAVGVRSPLGATAGRGLVKPIPHIR